MLNYSIMKLDDEHIDEYCEDIAYQVRRGIATMPLFCMTLTPEGIPAIDKAAMLSAVYKKYKHKLDSMGIPSGVLIQASIGHGWKLNESSAFQKYVGLADGDIPEVCCPLDKDFQAYIRRSAATIAATHPDHIMLDDDFRLMLRPSRGCVCPLHIRKFNKLAGSDIAGGELYDILCREDEVSVRYREIFVKTQIDSLIECAKEIRGGIDEVDPSIPGSYCLCGMSAEGAYEIASIMAGEGNPVTVRLNNANYCKLDPRRFAHIMLRASTEIAALRGTPDVLLAETDTCPQNRYSTSAAMMHSQFTFSILEGVRGAKHWITRLAAYEPNSGVAYRKKLEKYSKFYNALADINGNLTWLGCKIPVPTEPKYQLTPRDLEADCDGWINHILDRFGLPMHFSNSGEGVCFFSEKYDRNFDDDQIMRFLSGSVVLDALAAESLIERGFGKYLGVDVKRWDTSVKNVSGEIIYPDGISAAQYDMHELIPVADGVKRYSDAYYLRDGVEKEILFPGVTAYKNELGGTVVVFAGNTLFEHRLGIAFGWLNETRKAQLARILTDLGELPIYYPDDAEVLLKAAKMPGGALLCAVLDMSLDPVENIRLVIRREVSSIRRLTSEGSYEDVQFVKDGDYYTLSATASVFDPVILVME